MHSDKKQERRAEQVSNHKLLAAQTQDIELLREQVEFLQELVEATKQELSYTQQQLQETQQELKSTNRELVDALTVETTITLLEAKELARTLIKNKKCSDESLSELISAIYNSSIKPKELEIKISAVQTMPSKSNFGEHVIAQSKQFKALYDKSMRDFIKMKIIFMENKALIKNKPRVELENICNDHFENSYLICSPPPPIFANKSIAFSQEKIKKTGNCIQEETTEIQHISNIDEESKQHLENLSKAWENLMEVLDTVQLRLNKYY